jgi:hypothetical protein
MGEVATNKAGSAINNYFWNLYNSFMLLHASDTPDEPGSGSRVVCYFDENGVCK